jgi:hypothetical protein
MVIATPFGSHPTKSLANSTFSASLQGFFWLIPLENQIFGGNIPSASANRLRLRQVFMFRMFERNLP